MKNIILTGYMGCGKSSVGKKLAECRNSLFVDTDSYIEEMEQMKITEIFAQKGEAYFRELETRCIEQLIATFGEATSGVVFATGGGLPMREVNRTLLKKLGKVYFLQAAKETIYERVKHDTTRPLLQCDDPLQKIEQMLLLRTSTYEAGAEVIIQVDGKSVEQIVEEIYEGENR